MKSILTLAEKYEVPWCHYMFYANDYSYVADSDYFRRIDGTYVKIGDGRYVPKEMREVFRRHMK